jgi:hypothetical protein
MAEVEATRSWVRRSGGVRATHKCAKKGVEQMNVGARSYYKGLTIVTN